MRVAGIRARADFDGVETELDDAIEGFLEGLVGEENGKDA